MSLGFLREQLGRRRCRSWDGGDWEEQVWACRVLDAR